MEVKTLIAVPCMDFIPVGFFTAFNNLNKPGETALSVTKNTLIYNARNLIARKAIEQGFDRVMWFDSDIIMPPNAMERLAADMDAGLDFVTGVYYKRVLPTAPVVFKDVWWRVNQGEAAAGAETVTDIPQGLFEVAGCGFGCCMTSVKMLKDLVDRVGAPFTPLIGVSEDLTFCLRAREAGYRIICDGRIQCGHIGQIEYNAGMVKHEQID